jgi:hypothetical protein
MGGGGCGEHERRKSLWAISGGVAMLMFFCYKNDRNSLVLFAEERYVRT